MSETLGPSGVKNLVHPPIADPLFTDAWDKPQKDEACSDL